MSARAIVILVVLSVSASAHAQQYRWLDEKGRVHYTDTPPPPAATEVKKKNLRGNAVGTQPNYDLREAQKNYPVTLYSHPVCQEACRLARDILTQRGVPFTEVSATDEAAAAEVRRLSGANAVPVLKVGALIEKTASEAAYNRALDIAGYPPAGVLKPAQKEDSAPR